MLTGLLAASLVYCPSDGSTQQTVEVQSDVPLAAFTATADSSGLTYMFADMSMARDSGDSLTYLWNFGDGSATSTDQNPTHTYTAEGNFTVTLTVTGVNGKSHSAMKILNVIDFNRFVERLAGGDADGSSKTWYLNRDLTGVTLGIYKPNYQGDPLNDATDWSFSSDPRRGGNKTALHERPCILDDEYTFEIVDIGGALTMRFVVDTKDTFFLDNATNGGYKDQEDEQCRSESERDIWVIDRAAEANETLPTDAMGYSNKSGDADRGGYTFSVTSNQLTLSGSGHYIGLISKSNDGDKGYLVPDMRQFTIEDFEDTNDVDTLTLSMRVPDGKDWLFTLKSYTAGGTPVPPVPVAVAPPQVGADNDIDFEDTLTQIEKDRGFRSCPSVTPTAGAMAECADLPTVSTPGEASGKLLKITESMSAADTAAISFDLTGDIDFTNNCGLKMLIFVESNTDMTLRLEDTAGGADDIDVLETGLTVGDGINPGNTAFKEISFDFSGVISSSAATAYDRLTFLLGDSSSGELVAWVDNIQVDDSVECPHGPIAPPTIADDSAIDFESKCAVINNFDGAKGYCVDTPDVAGITGSTKSLKITDPMGVSNNAGIWFDLSSAMDLTANCGVKMLVMADSADTKLTLKLEGGSPAVQVTPSTAIGPVGEFVSVSFDFKALISPFQADKYNRLVFFVDKASSGTSAAEKVVHIDNIQLDNTVEACEAEHIFFAVPTTTEAIDFEDETLCGQVGPDLAISPFGGNSAACEDIPASATTANMASGKVLKVQESSGEVGAGVSLNLQGTIDLTDACGFTVDVHVPDRGAGNTLAIKAELEDSASPLFQGSPSIRADLGNIEIPAAAATAFERVQFNFKSVVPPARMTGTFSRIGFRLSNNLSETVAAYFDNIQLDNSIGDCIQGTVPLSGIDFESDPPIFLNRFNGAVSTIVNLPTVSDAGAAAGKVLKLEDPARVSNNAGVSFDVAGPIDFSTNCGLKMLIYSASDIATNVALKLEGGLPARQVEQTGPALTQGNGDEGNTAFKEVSFDFSSEIADSQKTSYDRLVFSIDFATTGTSTVAKTIFVDNIVIDDSVGACAGPEPPSPPTATTAIDFGTMTAPTCPTTLETFNNNHLPIAVECIKQPTVSNNDEGASGQVLKIVERRRSAAGAGVKFTLSAPIIFSATEGCGIKMDVYAQTYFDASTVNADLLLRLEGSVAPQEKEITGITRGDGRDSNTAFKSISFNFSDVITSANAMAFTSIALLIDINLPAEISTLAFDPLVFIDNIQLDSSVACTGL